MDDFIAYSSRWRTAGLVMGSLVFVAIGLWMIGAIGPAPTSGRYSQSLILLAGWASIIFFGFCAAGWGKRLVDRQAQLRIGAAGIHSAPWSTQTIPWSEISDVGTWSSQGQTMIVLHLRDRTRYPGRGLAAMLADTNRGLTGGDVSISLTGTDRTVEEALSWVERFHAATESVP